MRVKLSGPVVLERIRAGAYLAEVDGGHFVTRYYVQADDPFAGLSGAEEVHSNTARKLIDGRKVEFIPKRPGQNGWIRVYKLREG